MERTSSARNLDAQFFEAFVIEALCVQYRDHEKNRNIG